MKNNKLIRTMIVEDERVVLEDLLQIIDWKKEGFDIVATAPNGKIGLRQYDYYKPDLIISDIRMPLVNGLSMIKSIKLTNPSVHFLILSAYDEFNYAKEAIRLGAEDYILKTEISEDYIRTKLQIIKKKLNHEADTAITVFAKKLVDYISTPIIHSREALDEIFKAVHLFPSTSLFEQNVELCNKTVAKEFQRLGVPDKYTPTEVLSYEALADWVFEQVKALELIDDLILHQKYSPVVINAHEYIHKNYMNPNLKAQMIADHVGLSTGRLGVLFKKETNQTINDAITTIRMNKAKELLSSGRYKVYEVSELVGYHTSQYFSTIFFNQTGQYPNQYRKGLEQ